MRRGSARKKIDMKFVIEHYWMIKQMLDDPDDFHVLNCNHNIVGDLFHYTPTMLGSKPPGSHFF